MAETQPQASDRRQSGLRIGAIIAIAVAVGFVVWAVVGSGDDDVGGNTAAGTGPVAVSYDGLTTLAAALSQPVYWVGPRGGTRYELQQLSDGKMYLRYLPEGVQAGDAGKHLTVATYPLEDAYSVTSGHATAQGSQQVDAGEGAVAFFSSSNPTSVYAAFDGFDQQIEVYDPKPGVARRLVAGGALAQVPTKRVTEAKAVTPTELRQLSASLGQPIYWAGPAPSMTYEVSQNADGSIYVRYLPEGTAVGDATEHRTIATYPLPDAFDQTTSLADDAGMGQIELDDGGVAVFPEARGAKNVYVAYPDLDYQVEVFDPVPGAARRLVTAGRIAPVR
jgi:hypothetical protein